jgi:selenide,water dikinase
MLTRGDKNNRVYVGDTISIAEHVSGPMQSALFDPQTAGGLLISLPPERADEYLAEVEDSRMIGAVGERREHLIVVK